MAFKNEYVPESAYEKYDMKKVCAAHNQSLGRDRFVYFDSWTIDHEKDALLVRIHSYREHNFEGYAFCWKGEWMFFDMRPAGHSYDKTRNAIWFRLLVKGFVVPDRISAQREAVIADLKEALTIQDTPTDTITDRSATIEFVGEQWA
jgi:hypothetical protein